VKTATLQSILASFALGGLALFLLPTKAGASVSESERIFIERERAEFHTLFVPELMENEDGDLPLPRDLFFREMEIILGQHRGRRPYENTILGERYRALFELEKTEGFTAFMRARWEAFYWDWREALDE